jgi:AsmA protein
LYRKALWALVALVALLLVAAVALPFLVDLSRLKPQVQAQVGRYLDARLDYESARLRLLGGPGLRLDRVRLVQSAKPFVGQEALRAAQVDVELELWPLFRGELVGRLIVDRPVVTVRLVPSGNNLAALVRGDQTPAAPEPAEPLPDTGPGELGFLERLSIEALDVRDATVQVWRDDAKEPFLDLSDLAAHVDSFAVNRPFPVKITLRLAYSASETRIDGPLLARLQPTIRIEDGRFERVSFGGDLRLDEVAIDAAGGQFVKAAGEPLALRFEGDATAAGAAIQSMDLALRDLEGRGSLRVFDWKTLAVAFGAEARTKELSKLAALFPKYGKALLKGPVEATVRLDGPLTMSRKLSGSLRAKASLGGSDLALDVAVVSFAGPKARIALRGRALHLDELLPEGAPEGEPPRPASGPVPRGGSGKLDELVAGLRKALPEADVDLRVKLGELRFSGFVLDDVALTAALDRLAASVESLRFGAFDGRLAARMAANLRRPGAPVVSGKLQLEGVQLAHVLDALFDGLPNVVSGHVEADAAFSTVAASLPTALAALDAKGSFRFAEGTFLPLNVGAAFERQLNAFFASLPVPAPKLQLGLEELGRLDDLDGSFRIDAGQAQISGAKSTDKGRLELAGTVGLAKGLDARVTWTASAAVREQVLAASKPASYLLDSSGELTVDAKLSGPVTRPKLVVDTASLLARIKGRVARDLTKDLTKDVTKGLTKELEKRLFNLH